MELACRNTAGAGQGLGPVGVLAALLLISGCERQPAPPENARPAAAPASGLPQWFTNVTARSGIRFQHSAGTTYFMPDQVGAGVAVLDFDNDGLFDLYFVQNSSSSALRPNQLFQQQSNGVFKDVSTGSGLDVAGRGMGAIAGDVNNDGLADVVLTEYGAARLFQNLGQGKFREVTQAAGIDNPGWAVPAAFLDYDRDGWLDLAVGNYLDYDPTQVCYDAHRRQDFCAPSAFPGSPTRLWRNRTQTNGAEPVFEEVTAAAGLSRSPGPAMGLVCADLTGDGWPDIFCADDGSPNRLFVNQHDGRFREEAIQRGLAFNAMGRTAANMGVAFANFHAGGRGGLFVTHLAEEFHALFRQDQPGLFSDVIAQSGLQQQAWRGTGFGTIAADFDLDGDVDLAFVNGLVRRAVPGHRPVLEGVLEWWATYAQRAQVFANKGDGVFTDLSEVNEAFCGQAHVGRSLAVADLNNDGAPDLIAASVGGPAQLFHNAAPKPGQHWLKLRLIEPARGGRDAIGAEVWVRAGGKTQWAVLQPAMSYLSSSAPVLHFGLGSAAVVDAIEVQWADGAREDFEGGPANRALELRKRASQ